MGGLLTARFEGAMMMMVTMMVTMMVYGFGSIASELG